MPGGTKLTKTAKEDNALLQFNLDPSNYPLKYLSPGVDKAIEAGTEFGGYYQNAPGVGSFTSSGNYIAPGQQSNLPTVLPGYEALANYNTLFENYDAGALSPSQTSVMDTYTGMLTGTGGGGGYFNPEALGALGAGGGVGGGGGIPAPPDFANRTLNVDNIGGIVGDIFEDMPAPFQEFTLNMLNTADPAYVEQQIVDFTTKISDFVNMSVEDTGRRTLDVFAAEGLGTSGAAIAGMVDIATRATVEASARISEYALGRYDQVIKQQEIAQQLQKDYLSAGAAEQGARVQYEMSKLQAEATAYSSYAQSQAQVQSSLIQANSQIQQQLISSSAQLEANWMKELGQAAGFMYQENQVENQQNTDALLLPYNIMQGQMNTTIQKGTGGGFGSAIGPLIGGLGAIASIAFPPAAPVIAPATAGIAGNIGTPSGSYGGLPI